MSSALLATAAILTWQLLSPLIRAPVTQADPQPAMARVSPDRPRTVLIADIQNAHLFGDASVKPAAMLITTGNGSVSVTGIVYSTDTEDSVALLSIAGTAIVSHVGTQLATGQIVAGILPDRVELRGSDGMTSLLLDIKQADPNQRISPGQFAAVSGTGDSSGVPMVPAALQASVAQNFPAMPTVRVTEVPTHFVPLQSIRGRSAAERFSKSDTPKTAGGPH